jgi:hypothetical protein
VLNAHGLSGATVHEDSDSVLERLCQLSRLSQFCQLKERTGRGPHVRAKHRLINGERNLDGVQEALFIWPAFFL